MTTEHPVYGHIDGPIVMIGFGSIGKGTLPLIERHFEYDAKALTVIEPRASAHNFLAQRGIRHLDLALTPEEDRRVLLRERTQARVRTPLLHLLQAR